MKRSHYLETFLISPGAILLAAAVIVLLYRFLLEPVVASVLSTVLSMILGFDRVILISLAIYGVGILASSRVTGHRGEESIA
jgi:cell division protein FtsX